MVHQVHCNYLNLALTHFIKAIATYKFSDMQCFVPTGNARNIKLK